VDWCGSRAHGAVKVRPDCSVSGHDEIFVIGGVAHLAGTDGRALPGLAAVATQHGKYVAKLIAARVGGRPAIDRFRYRNLGTLAMIGRSRAVVVYINWSWAWFTYGRGARLITREATPASHAVDRH
jgi:NADH dehydrogenase